MEVITNTDTLVVMELRHLRYFCAVAERKSFTLAGRQLHVSQSGVSGQIRDLEREIGVTLLKREAREVSLTIEGSIFFQEAQAILERADRAVALTVRASQGMCGTLSIGLCGPATAPLLPDLIRRFRRLQPGAEVRLEDLDPAHQPAALQEGRIDVGFTRDLPQRFSDVLACEIFFREPILAVLPEQHPLAGETTVDLRQLAADRFILYARDAAPSLFDTILGFCRKARFSPNISATPHLWQSILTLVEAEEGVSLVPACVQSLRSTSIVYRPLAGRKYLVDVLLAWRKDRGGALRDLFLELLRTSSHIARSSW